MPNWGNMTAVYRGQKEIDRVYLGQELVWENRMQQNATEATFVLTSNMTQPIYLTQSTANAVTVDWGDGSTREQSADLSASFSHTYAEAGTYEVEISCADGETWSPGRTVTSGNTTTYYGFSGGTSGKSGGSTSPTLTAFSIGTGCLLSQQYGFSGCTSLTEIVIPNTITEIAQELFHNCTSLQSITIPSSVRRIGSAAFNGCDAISALYIDDLAAWVTTSIGSNTNANAPYYDLNNIHSPHVVYLNGFPITNLVIPNSVTSICRSAFNSCTSITSVYIPSSVTSCGAHAFLNCTNLTSVDIDGLIPFDTEIGLVEVVGGGVFGNCTSLTSVRFGTACTDIRHYAFSGCTALESIVIPSTVQSIGQDAFSNCIGMSKAEVGAKLLQEGVFRGCTQLESLWLRDTVETIQAASNTNGVCYQATNATIYAEAAAKPSGWGQYYDVVSVTNSGETTTLTRANTVWNQTTSPF